MSHKKILLFLLLLFSVFITINISDARHKRYFVPIEDSPSIGPEGAPVTIIEFLDYQ